MAAEELFESLPRGWECTTLGEACARTGGNIQTGPFGTQLHASDYVPEGIPSIMPQNIGDNRILEDGIARIKSYDAERLSRYLVRSGDIVYSRRGDVERRALIRDHEDGWLCGTGCLRIRFEGGSINSVYASYYLGDAAVRDWIVRHARGATMPNLNTAILSALPFLIPPREDQNAIAMVLGSLDDKIELNRLMNGTLETIVQAIFKSWFVDFDPVRAKTAGQAPPDLDPEIAALFPDSFEQSELGEIPNGWSIGPILKHAELLSGGTPKTERADYWNGSILWASAKDVSQCNHLFLVTTERTITGKGLEESATQLIPTFCTVVVARGATTGRMVIFGREMAMNQTCYALASTTRTPFALYCYLRYEMADLVHAAHGSVFDTITTSTFSSSRVVLPPKLLLEAFDTKVAPVFKRILANTEESRTITDLRDALLPKLLSGEIRANSFFG